ncbi:MAG: hypothetical protein BYD32DRAFT_422992 [Podila humilis]|nr:MAG: hypothetical protein BYD32DRAFT_422992 [Podila humilis]
MQKKKERNIDAHSASKSEKYVVNVPGVYSLFGHGPCPLAPVLFSFIFFVSLSRYPLYISCLLSLMLSSSLCFSLHASTLHPTWLD